MQYPLLCDSSLVTLIIYFSSGLFYFCKLLISLTILSLLFFLSLDPDVPPGPSLGQPFRLERDRSCFPFFPGRRPRAHPTSLYSFTRTDAGRHIPSLFSPSALFLTSPLSPCRLCFFRLLTSLFGPRGSFTRPPPSPSKSDVAFSDNGDSVFSPFIAWAYLLLPYIKGVAISQSPQVSDVSFQTGSLIPRISSPTLGFRGY